MNQLKKRSKEIYELIRFIINPLIILIIPNSAGKIEIPVFRIGILALCGSPYLVTEVVGVIVKFSPELYPTPVSFIPNI